MGLIANIYKNGGTDCSNGGLSSRYDKVTVVNVDGPFDPADDRPAVMLLPGNLPGVAKVVPVVGGNVAQTHGPMMGGCYVATSDSRFVEAVERITGARFYGAVALHDRYETPEQYRSLSL